MTEDKKRTNSRTRQRRARQRRNRRILTTVCLMALVMVVSIGGTIAWLTAKTTPVVNTFTAGDINITLAETTTEYKMVPGNTIAKNPKVTVTTGSENCWLFVKIDKANDLDNFIAYDIADGWTELTTGSGIYYRTVLATDTVREFSVLANDQVTVKRDVTKAMLNALTETTRPKLTFTAYACQKDNIDNVTDAWTQAQTATVSSGT